jgi:hypothetical protein
MHDELENFERNQVWELVYPPPGCKPIGTMWVWKNKEGEKGEVVTNKSRLVAQGFSQKEGIDYGDLEGPIRRTREGGSEWEPIKILLEGDRNSNKMNKASNTRLRLTTQVGQAHVATGVPLDQGTNTQPSDSRTQQNTKPRVYRPTPVRPVPAGEIEQLSLSGSTPVRPVRHTSQTDHSLKAPKAPNRPTDHQTDPNSKQQHHRMKDQMATREGGVNRSR